MTQQAYYPPQQGQPQYPTYPQQTQQAPPEWAQPQQQWTPPGQPMQQSYGQPQQPPAQPLANGGLDEFYGQPNTGGGPGVSWKGKPDGYTVQGVVPRDVGDGDVSQEIGAPGSDKAGQPLTYRDGRPKFVMAVPLQVAPSQEYPEGEARLFVRGQLRDELSRAMAEAGAQGAPVAGSTITVTLVQRKQGRGAIPMNVFAVVYTPPGGQAPQVQQPQQQFVQQPQYQAPSQYAQQPPAQYQQQFAPQPAVHQQQAPGAPSPAPGAPPVQQQGSPQPPAGLSPEQQQLLAQMQQNAGG